MESKDLRFIQSQIGYEFKNLDLLQQAFIRRSFSEENGGENNEVLEFIGDKVLDLFAVKYLTEKHGFLLSEQDDTEVDFDEFSCEKTEAELTEIKKILVQKKTLANRIDVLGLSDYLLMGKGDILQNISEENSVKEDLFEAILGAIAIDSNWNMEALENATLIMLAPESILSDSDTEDYVSLIQKWSYSKNKSIPLYHFDKSGYEITWYTQFDGVSQQPESLIDREIHKSKYHCLTLNILKIKILLFFNVKFQFLLSSMVLLKHMLVRSKT
jgi:ribonuclease-3